MEKIHRKKWHKMIKMHKMIKIMKKMELEKRVKMVSQANQDKMVEYSTPKLWEILSKKKLIYK